MRILFIGCVKASEIFLKNLINAGENIVGVITKSQSNFNSDFSDLGKICKDHGIDYMYADDINDDGSKRYIKNKDVDLILCLGWSRLLDREVLKLPRMGCVGFHPAELPYNRGRHPLIWALALGLTRTASTLFMMDETADTGQVLTQEYIKIDYEDDAQSLYNKVMKAAVVQLEEVLQEFKNEAVKFLDHPPIEGNIWRKRRKEDGKIDWRMSSRGIYNLVRALTKPYVGAHFLYQSKAYKVWKVKEVFESGYDNIEPGKIIRVMSNNNFIVKTGDNLIEVIDCDPIEIKAGEYF